MMSFWFPIRWRTVVGPQQKDQRLLGAVRLTATPFSLGVYPTKLRHK